MGEAEPWGELELQGQRLGAATPGSAALLEGKQQL